MSPSPHVFDVTEDTFAVTVLDTSERIPVLVDFWASWCGPCRTLLPVVTRLAEKYQGQFVLAKVNIDEQPGLASRFAVRSVPTVKLMRHGNVVEEFLGVQPESAIRELIERHLERESDRVIAAAREKLRIGETQEAMAMLEQARTTEPENMKLRLALAEVLVTAGDHDGAQAELETLPLDLRMGAEANRLAASLAFLKAVENAPPQELLAQRLNANPGDSEARYQLAARLVLAKEFGAAMEQLLELIRRDRAYGNDAGRLALLKVFELLGGSGELVSRYRSRMFNALH